MAKGRIRPAPQVITLPGMPKSHPSLEEYSLDKFFPPTRQMYVWRIQNPRKIPHLGNIRLPHRYRSRQQMAGYLVKKDLENHHQKKKSREAMQKSPSSEKKIPFWNLLLPILALGILSGCAAHQGSGITRELSVFKPLDDIQGWRGLFDPASDGESGFFSENPQDYIDENGIATGVPTTLRRGWIVSPWAPTKGIVDVRRHAEGDIVNCPYTGKPLRIPKDKEYKAVHVHP